MVGSSGWMSRGVLRVQGWVGRGGDPGVGV